MAGLAQTTLAQLNHTLPHYLLAGSHLTLVRSLDLFFEFPRRYMSCEYGAFLPWLVRLHTTGTPSGNGPSVVSNINAVRRNIKWNT